MKKIFILSLAVLSLFSSCDKETENNSFITHYVDLQLKGDKVMSQKLGTTFVDPGFTAEENGQDVAGNVKVSGSVDTNTPGAYKLTYQIANADGYSAVATRLICVNNPQTLEGVFMIYAGRPGGTTYNTYISIEKTEEEGVYSVDCLLGAWYSIGRNYGEDCAGAGHIKVADDGTISLVDGYVPYWETEVTSLEGSFDKETGTFKWTTVWNGYTFTVESM
ncbi:MAG: DUF5012 domain-containing protein [Bacteroidales bacterium]|nr:DUF5012 domain-containing protein [Bacteroidales bacterium]